MWRKALQQLYKYFPQLYGIFCNFLQKLSRLLGNFFVPTCGYAMLLSVSLLG
nr:MAG TPA: Replication factor A protein 3, heterotrimer, DNA binding, OB-fold.7A [Caudoviricetes sp.]